MTIFRSFSFRLALIYVALFVGSTALLAGIYYVSSIWIPLARVEARISREFDQLRQLEARRGEAALLRALEARAAAISPNKAFHAVVAPDGRVLASNLPSWPRQSKQGWVQIESDMSIDGDEVDYEALTLDRTLPDGSRLLIGRDIETIHAEREQLSAAAAWVLGLSALFGIGGGVLMSFAISRRIAVVNRAAHSVISGDLSGRIELRGTGDDFDRLGETLNLMLARIEALVESIRRVSDNVAHELRTPLARLRADLETLNASDANSLGLDFEAAVAEAVRLEAIFEAVLRIARLESRRHGAVTASVNLTELLDDAVEFYMPSAEDKDIRVLTELNRGLEVAGDADLIFQAICNILDNAVKFTPRGGTVCIRVRRTGDFIETSVSDTGPGVRASDRDHLTERFYRADGTSEQAGAGLGLSLVAAVADHHCGKLSFGENAPGLVVKFALPERNAQVHG